MKARTSVGGSWRLALMVAGMAVFISGCSLLFPCKPGKPGKPQAYDLHIKLGTNLQGSSVVVDVLPANQYNLEKLKNYSVNKYWKSGDSLRQDTPKVTFSFVSGDKLEQTLPATDPKWKEWMDTGVQYLVIIADLPGVFDDGKVGSQDPRRQILPICKCYWDSGTKDLVVEVQRSGVHIATPPRPDQPLPPGW
jgi:hypothetical protein